MYTMHPLVEGFPGKSSSHGGFGWSSLWLLECEGRRVLVDTGPPAYIPLIHDGLAERGLTAADITDVLVTHLHWDHVGNFTMFPNAVTWVGAAELKWAAEQPAGTNFVADLHVEELLRRKSGVARIRGGQEILPGITAVDSPGHTPGHLAFHVATSGQDHIFAGDAVKNIFELSTLRVDSTMDEHASRQTVDRLKCLLKDTGGVLVPGHDVGLTFEDGLVLRSREQCAAVGFFVDGEMGEQDRSIK
ncbi:N-acyl homoserine lactone hydrolase [Mycobacterium frederiksbergense]|uniref:N-acyl homoserine lactone hydrolase n=1 Tax=Mycolicibacterium frederiksbergense TaxID=117567 RepID=A0ABT6L1M6_9MYCO|nr:MBL fold metallo-hydrolase [Mycolicibacterium frederiksbergense]MDH6196853.1 N-acyl homoserine lactone hydrolase [Mycolicibacterium frederiksbergense]